jgi:hypothetical protein
MSNRLCCQIYPLTWLLARARKKVFSLRSVSGKNEKHTIQPLGRSSWPISFPSITIRLLILQQSCGDCARCAFSTAGFPLQAAIKGPDVESWG